MLTRTMDAFGVLLVLAGLAIGCGRDKPPGGPTEEPSPDASQETGAAGSSAGLDGATDTSADGAGGVAGASVDGGAGDGDVDARADAGGDTAPGDLTISDGPTYDFGVRPLGATKTHVFTITSDYLQSLALAAPLTAPFALQEGTLAASGTCGTILASNGSCTVAVVFAPTADGAASGTFSIMDGHGNTVSISLAGSGTIASGAVLAISDGPQFSYGDVGYGFMLDHTFTVTNTGHAAATMLTPGMLPMQFLFRGGAYPGTGGTCGTTLAAGASCTIVVTYYAIIAPHTVVTLTITYDDSVEPASTEIVLEGSNLGFPWAARRTRRASRSTA